MREIQPISGASVWHGRKMASSSRWRRRLSDAPLAEIDRAVRQASARGLGWQTMTADDFPLPSCAALAEDIRAELEDGSGIVLLFAGDPVPTGRRRREGPARTAPGHIAGMTGRVRPDIGVAQRMRDRANTPRPVGTATSEALWKTKPPN
jgi:hypothetical protein